MGIFVGIFAYGFGKKLRTGGVTPDKVSAALALEQDELGEASSVPAFRTLARLRKLEENVIVWTDCYAALIAKARSMACGLFLDTNDATPACNQMLLLDEDMDVPADALEELRRAANQASGRKRIATACVRIGDGSKVSVHPKRIVMSAQHVHTSADELPTLMKRSPFEVEATGFACAWMPVECVRRIVSTMGRECLFRTGAVRDGKPLYAPALFLESVQNGEWINEDHAFSMRVRMSRVDLVSVVHPGVVHDGMRTVTE